jgi:hypothetical protein
MKKQRRDRPGRSTTGHPRAAEGDPAGVKRLLSEDRWAEDAGVTHDGPWRVRWREPLLSRHEAGVYVHCLQIVWTFAAEGVIEALSPEKEAELFVFEVALRASLESDALAVLTAILTFDGTRQWILYTHDVATCFARLDALPREGAPRPIERDAFEDRTWEFLREEILGGVRGGDD